MSLFQDEGCPQAITTETEVEDGDQSSKPAEIPRKPKQTSNPLVPSVRKRKSTMDVEKVQLLSLAKARLTEQEDPYLSQAKTWANELKSMDRRQQLLAKKFINEILFEGQCGTLHKESVKINCDQASSRCSTPYSSSSSHYPSHSESTAQNDQGNEGVHFVQPQNEYTIQQSSLAQFFTNFNPDV